MKKILYSKDRKYFWTQGDLHTQEGAIKESEIIKAKPGRKVKSSSGNEFTILNANFIDQIQKIKRGPQALLPKDIAIIINYTNVNKNYKIVDAGTGSGMLAAFLAFYGKEVTTYDINNDNIKLAAKNFEKLKLKNIKIKNEDISEGISERKLDLITLDLPQPEKIIKYADKSLKPGAYLVSYSPQITQVMAFVKELNNHAFKLLKVIEILEREWHVEERKVRPKSQMQGHSAFLVFTRKL